VTREFPQLVAKWQARGNPNLNQNHNVQMMSAKRRIEEPKITVVTCGGAMIRIIFDTK
jgi:hypothetical protein